VVDGEYVILFRIYDNDSNGNTLWSSIAAVQVTDGLFSYLLGSDNLIPDSLANYDSLWLGVKVGVDPELTPRTRLVSVSYAYKALVAETAELATAIADNTVSSSKIQDGSIQFDDIGQNGAETNHVLKWNGSAWVAAQTPLPPGRFPAPAWDSGWFYMDDQSDTTLAHELGGNHWDYLVEMQFWDDEEGIHNRGLGADRDCEGVCKWEGAFYRLVEPDSISVHNYDDWDRVDSVRIRIWTAE
jgi:hypothetical protein